MSENEHVAFASMKQWIEDTVKNLVDQPEEVRVVEYPATQSVTYEVFVAQPDFRYLIGKEGSHADAMRSLLAAMSRKKRIKYVLNLIDPVRGKSRGP